MSSQTLPEHSYPWGLKSLDIKISFLGWGGYMALLLVYCTLYKVIVSDSPPDILGSLTWVLKQWAIWPVLTLAAFALLRRHDTFCTSRTSRTSRALRQSLVQLGVAAILISLIYRLAIDLVVEPGHLSSSLVLSVPRYLLAFVVISLIWYFWLRSGSVRPALEAANEDGIRMPGYPDRLLVSKGNDECLVRLDDVTCISAAGNYVEVYCEHQLYLMRATMKEVEEKLPPDEFIRIHRSHIVRLRDVDRIRTLASGNGTVRLRCGRELRISKRYKSQLQKYRLQAA